MAKIFATFAIKGATAKLVKGPDGDYQGQRKAILDARENGTGDADALWMVDIKRGLVKRATSQTQNLPQRRADRAKYRESLASKPADKAKAEPAPAPKKKSSKS